MLKIIYSDNEHFIHLGGFRTNNNNFTTASIVWPYIAFQEKTKWGLESITGISMLAPKYDSIVNFHDNIILNKGKRWEVLPVNYFYPLLDGEEVAINLSLDNIMMWSEDYI